MMTGKMLFKDKSHMYRSVKTWNVFVGCGWEPPCNYCERSFRAQAKRQKHRCRLCYEYKPHFHVERLHQVPSGRGVIFVAGYGDICFAPLDVVRKIMNEIQGHWDRTFYVQTKDPSCYKRWEIEGIQVPQNVVLGITAETNVLIFEYNYVISGAPQPARRLSVFATVKHPRKFITIEPIMTFLAHGVNFETMMSNVETADGFVEWIKWINPEFVYVGYCNHNWRELKLPEPTLRDTEELIGELKKFTEVRIKTLRKAWWEK